MSLPDHIEIPLTDDNSVLLHLVRIPAGSFLMGARMNEDEGDVREEPVNKVCIPFDFYLAQTPVMQQQFSVWTKHTGIKHENGFPDHSNHPAENMSWDQSVQFCQWVVERYRHCQSENKDWPADYQCLLPTEAQWEYACSAWHELTDSDGTVRRIYTHYHTGDGEAALSQAGWFAGNSDGQTHPVGQKQANRHELFDMHGNVWEWCVDGWDVNAYRHRPPSVKDPWVASSASANRVIRGGSWGNRASDCRAACRYGRHPDDRYRDQGFRVGLFPVHSCQTKQSAE